MALYRYAENNSSNAGYYKNTDEFKNQTLKNRSTNYDNAPGNVFYNTLAWVYDAPFREKFKTDVFQYPALPPAIHWKAAPEQEPISFTGPPQGSIISWIHNSDENVRYAVYAVPIAKRNETGAFSKSEHLVSITYDKQFRMKKGISTSTHKIAVSVIDRYGNEYAPRVFGESPAAPITAVLTYPDDNASISKATLFQWQGASDVDCYIWQLSRNSQFTDLVASMETTDTKYNSGLVGSIEENTTYWWRVKTRKANTLDTWSEARQFTIGTASGIKTSVTTNSQIYVYNEYGNPYLFIYADKASNAILELYSTQGYHTFSQTLCLLEGENRIPLSLPNKEMYIAKLQIAEKQLTLKITN